MNIRTLGVRLSYLSALLWNVYGGYTSSDNGALPAMRKSMQEHKAYLPYQSAKHCLTLLTRNVSCLLADVVPTSTISRLSSCTAPVIIADHDKHPRNPIILSSTTSSQSHTRWRAHYFRSLRDWASPRFLENYWI